MSVLQSIATALPDCPVRSVQPVDHWELVHMPGMGENAAHCGASGLNLTGEV